MCLAAGRTDHVFLENLRFFNRDDLERNQMTYTIEALQSGSGLPAVQAYSRMANDLPIISLIIPAHNEERRLPRTLDRYEQALRDRYGNNFEIIVVANGCEDETARVASEKAAGCDQLRVLNIPERIGKGGAVLRGYHAARGERVLFADADGATSPESLLQLSDQLEYHDGVVASRRLTQSTIARPQSRIRVALSKVFAFAVGSLFRLGYSDTQCGAKGFRRAAVADLVSMVTETGWAFDVDLLLCAAELRLDVVEFPVHWTDDEHSRLRVMPTMVPIGRALLRLKHRHSSAAAAGRQRLRAGTVAPLRILALNWRCLCHPQAGGAEVNLFEQARRWVEQGHSVTVACATSGHGQAQCACVADGIEVLHMGSRFGVYPLVAAYLLRHGGKYDRVLDVANGIPFFAPLFTRTPATLMVHHVHAEQWFVELAYPLAMVGWWLEKHAVRRVYPRNSIVTVSQATRDGLLSLGFPAQQIRVIYNGVTLPEAPPADVERRNQKIAYVGRIKRYKRLDRLVDAVAHLRHEFGELHLDIAGDGDARQAIEEQVRRDGLDRHVTIHGYVDDSKKAEILSSASVFATPSMHEGWGISVLEANAFGCPAVAYDVPGLNAAIRHGETGLLADDDGDFEAALAQLLRDHALRERYAAEARRWAQHFTWDTTAFQTLEVLNASAGLPSAGANGWDDHAARYGLTDSPVQAGASHREA